MFFGRFFASYCCGRQEYTKGWGPHFVWENLGGQQDQKGLVSRRYSPTVSKSTLKCYEKVCPAVSAERGLQAFAAECNPTSNYSAVVFQLTHAIGLIWAAEEALSSNPDAAEHRRADPAAPAWWCSPKEARWPGRAGGLVQSKQNKHRGAHAAHDGHRDGLCAPLDETKACLNRIASCSCSHRDSQQDCWKFVEERRGTRPWKLYS